MGMSQRHVHFTPAELQARVTATIDALERDGLSALVMFRQESMYWLTGYDTFGYVHFQAMVLTADGRLVLLTRSADRLQAAFTSTVEDVRIWRDREGAMPEAELADILRELGLSGQRLGIEYEAWGLTAAKGKRFEAALGDAFALEDASLLVSRLRAVKSAAEIAYVRRAAELADAALAAAQARAAAGVFEGDILADMHGAIARGGGDDPANEFIIGSGPGALMCRYYTGRRTLADDDLLTLEHAGVYRHYHAAMMRTFVVGRLDPRVSAMHAAAHDALLATEEALRPGRPIGEAFDAHARVLDAAGFGHARLNACGYCLGTTFAPSWMDWPMLYEGQSYEARPGNVFFAHMILFDEAAGLAMTLGRTSLVGERGAEPLSAASLALVRA
ncbi:M24 family metallopeptidase [Salinarimonas sp. NSM]|uniref:M24 family metallopeptidase n=1 Tax=Salinarimonas sp. NSM TaxID=3458003 RepID=UPI00403594F6